MHISGLWKPLRGTNDIHPSPTRCHVVINFTISTQQGGGRWENPNRNRDKTIHRKKHLTNIIPPLGIRTQDLCIPTLQIAWKASTLMLNQLVLLKKRAFSNQTIHVMPNKGRNNYYWLYLFLLGFAHHVCLYHLLLLKSHALLVVKGGERKILLRASYKNQWDLNHTPHTLQ